MLPKADPHVVYAVVKITGLYTMFASEELCRTTDQVWLGSSSRGELLSRTSNRKRNLGKEPMISSFTMEFSGMLQTGFRVPDVKADQHGG
jgi:hypothetical protein